MRIIKRLLKVILITAIVAVILIFILFLASLRNPLSFIDFKFLCSAEAKNVISEKNFGPVHNCSAEKINIDGYDAKIVQIRYGRGHDCLSGCIYDSYTGLLHNDVLIDFHAEPNLFRVLFDKCGYWCQFEMRKNSSAIKKFITFRDGYYYWGYEFNNFSNKEDIIKYIAEDKRYAYMDNAQYGIFNGKFIITKIESYYAREADFSGLSIELRPLEGFSPISAKELTEQCLKDTNDQTRCITDIAAAKGDPKLCFLIRKSFTDVAFSQGSCIRSVAFDQKDPSMCEMITDSLQKDHCYENVGGAAGN